MSPSKSNNPNSDGCTGFRSLQSIEILTNGCKFPQRGKLGSTQQGMEREATLWWDSRRHRRDTSLSLCLQFRSQTYRSEVNLLMRTSIWFILSYFSLILLLVLSLLKKMVVQILTINIQSMFTNSSTFRHTSPSRMWVFNQKESLHL